MVTVFPRHIRRAVFGLIHEQYNHNNALTISRINSCLRSKYLFLNELRVVFELVNKLKTHRKLVRNFNRYGISSGNQLQAQ